MLEFTRVEMEQFAVHYTGNKANGEELTHSGKVFQFKEDFVKDSLLKYFLTPFRNDIYYRFVKKDDIKINAVHSYVSEIFQNKKLFFGHSKKIATHLYNQSNHPKIKGGEFYMTYFKDCVADGELCDAIGIFKSENKETYLKIFQHLDEFEIESENGININKLDKGCLIFNTEKEAGYKISIVDNSHKLAEAALYWTEDFLNSTLREDNFYHTQHVINACKGFCEEVLTEENNVPKKDQMMMMSRSMNYFKE
ncbi:MAG TPA: nucleoid-associated protein, partial [Nitrosopumilaceae archaeon]|nr:nucleoid-associated protein [Nitrosopumilaceae archaeon]